MTTSQSPVAPLMSFEPEPGVGVALDMVSFRMHVAGSAATRAARVVPLVRQGGFVLQRWAGKRNAEGPSALEHQIVHAEERVRIGPAGAHLPARLVCQRAKTLERIFAR